MKQQLKNITLGLSVTLGGLLAGCVLWQKYCFWQGRKMQDDQEYELFQSDVGHIAYRSKGNGRPLVLLHSMFLGSSQREWDQVIEVLAESYHVYALDLPGFGQSFYPQKPWTAYQYAQCIYTFLEQVVGRPACILAANGGADLALILTLLHPEKIKGLLLVSPEGIGKGFATNETLAPLKKLLFPIGGTQSFIMATGKRSMKAYLERLFFAKEKITKEMVQAHVSNARTCEKSQVTFASLETGLWRADTKQALASLNLPLWMIWGEENKDNPIAHMEQAKDLCPKGDFIVFEETGTFPHIENSVAFGEIVKECLK